MVITTKDFLKERMFTTPMLDRFFDSQINNWVRFDPEPGYVGNTGSGNNMMQGHQASDGDTSHASVAE